MTFGADLVDNPELDHWSDVQRQVDALIEVGTDMAQEIQDIIDAMREASGDDRDGVHLEQLLERWEMARRACYADEET